MNAKQLFVGAAAAVVLLGTGARAAQADVCIDGATRYLVQIGTATPASGTPVVLSGLRLGNPSMPISGALSVTTGLVKIAIDEHFDWGTGEWAHPHGTTVLILNLNTGAFTFDTTYHGNGAPINVKGTATFCPASSSTSSDNDPNRK